MNGRGRFRQYFSLILIFLQVFTVFAGEFYALPEAKAKDYYEAYQGEYDKNKPISWLQGGPPHNAKEFAFCSENQFGYCACGVHTMANLLLKGGFWGAGKDAWDGYQFAKDKGIGSSAGGVPAYNWQGVTNATGGKIKWIEDYWGSDASSTHDYIKEHYKKGHLMVLSVNMGGIGHLIIVDYVDKDGDIVVVDSGRRYKYLKAMDGGGWVRDVQVFEAQGKSKPEDIPKFWEGEAATGGEGDGEGELLGCELDGLVTGDVMDTSKTANVNFWFHDPDYASHTGMDLSYMDSSGNIIAGGDIYAAADGEVVLLEDGHEPGDRGAGGGWGNHIRLKHANGFYTLYAHVKAGSFKFKQGDTVKKGDKIAEIGLTGRTDGYHLHLELTKSENVTERIDPYPYFDWSKWKKSKEKNWDGGDVCKAKYGAGSKKDKGKKGNKGVDYKFDENLIPNMPKDRDYKDSTFSKFGQFQLQDETDKRGVKNWQQENEQKNNIDVIKLARRLVTVIGILFLLMSTLIWVIYIFDTWNMMDISLIKLITGGRVRFVEDWDIDKKKLLDGKLRLLTMKDVVIWSVIFVLLGILVLSGTLYAIIEWVVTLILASSS